MTRVCVVTGATRGIGRAILEGFAARGDKCIGTYRGSQSEAENMCMDLPIDMYRLDIQKRGEIRKFITQIGEVYGRVDVIVNNAGYWEKGDMATLKAAQIDDMFDAHCHGPMWMVKYAMEYLSAGSAIVNIASNGALRGGTEAPHYAAAKAALLSWTRSLSRLLAPRTRVNAVAPGIIRTDLVKGDPPVMDIPLQRLGTAQEVAWAVDFLSDERSGYTTGQTLVIDGGQYV